MKMKTELEPICVYRSLENESKVKTELSQSQEALQSTLDVWGRLELIPCTDIVGLILNPAKCYEDAVDQSVAVPVVPGKYQISKDVWIKNLSIPVPNQLYLTCKAARAQSYCANRDLWSVEGDKVIMDIDESTSLIERENIWTNDPKQAEVCKKITAMVNAINEGDEVLNGLLLSDPLTRQRLSMNFHFIEQGNSRPKLAINADLLRRWIQGIF
jgi:hypothetical protein